MKTQLQIRTGDFEYIMQECEADANEAVAAFKALKEAWAPKPGLAPKVWNDCIDSYMATGTLVSGTELYVEMNEKQQFFFQELKKHNKRANYKGVNEQ